MSAAPPAVFVSYCHRDEAWKDRLVKHLEVLEFEGAVDVWDDRRIAAGDEWRPEIEQAIERAAVAVLIVSPDFLTSRFIREQELTRILERRSRQQLRVVPLIARPCAWTAVAALQGIQARPLDGRALSGGNEHQIDADLADLALEIRDLLTGAPPGTAESSITARLPGRHGGTGRRRSIVLLLWLGLPSVVAGLLTWTATMWHVPTRVSIELFTRRLSFVVSGRDRPSLLNANRQFSLLTIERCGTVSFQAEEFGRGAGSDDREGASTHSGPVRLNCADPDAKITLASRTDPPIGDRAELPPIGALDRLPLDEGATVVLDVAASSPPVLTLDVATPQRLDLAIHAPLHLTADLVHVETPSHPSSPLTTYRVRVAEANRLMRVESTARGIVLVVTPAADHAAEFFNSEIRLPVAKVQFLDEALNEGVLTSPLVRDGVLSYPEYPSMTPVPVPQARFFVPTRTSMMVITHIAVTSDGTGLGLTMEGVLHEGGIGTPGTSTAGGGDGRWRDPRLTLYQILRYGSPWGIVAGVAAWVMATAWIGYERWKKLVGGS